ncbi:cytochrome c3 family protein [Acidisphaera sp. L21]|uniref:cytochrome c3 family protein n=1 Tax=Acidisphaera sp. L21 TaxID=1641851 RepID=UPI00131B72C6|nr:cytochrome c3 family protein [Acidisphaera sp. L21]
MAAIFRPHANVAAKAVLLGLALLLLTGTAWWWGYPRTDYARRVGYTIDQPIPFSHEHHVAGLGIQCELCHSTVEVSAKAGMPPTYTCMTCHSQIWTNAAVLAPLRDSLASNTPIAWGRVTNLPDYVYFNHSIHVAKGVGCSSCHGQVDKMALMAKAAPMTMQFCLDCHRNPGPQLRPESEIFNTEWVRTTTMPSPAAMVQHYHIGGRNLTDCSICHR